MDSGARQRGFSLFEVIIAMALAGLVLSGLMIMLQKAVHFRGTVGTLANIEKLNIALETMYRGNVRWAEDRCYGWTDTGAGLCNRLSILPTLPAGGDPHKLFVRTYSSVVTQAFQAADCTVSGTAPTYAVTCPDGYGGNFRFQTTNEHTPATYYDNAYALTPYTLLIASEQSATAPIVDTWSSAYLDSEYMVRSREKVMTVLRAMKGYHLQRLAREATVNSCKTGSGGLQSYDDVIIPWIWQALGSGPTTDCSGVTGAPCGCSGFSTSVWVNSFGSGSNANTLRYGNTGVTAAMLNTFAASIGLDPSCLTDGFGNSVTIIPLSSPSHSPLSRPDPPIPTYAWATKPPYGGHVGVYDPSANAWLISERIIYAQ
jgi:prepilin-type N-terminal cleavage/methylation domain-containing protein